MEREVGITVGADQIIFHCHDTQATVELQKLIQAEDSGLLLQWGIFWQLLTLNKKIDDANAKAAEAAKVINPTEMADAVLRKFGLNKE